MGGCRGYFQILNQALIVHRGASFRFTGSNPGETKLRAGPANAGNEPADGSSLE